jgi:hypothetical protein
MKNGKMLWENSRFTIQGFSNCCWELLANFFEGFIFELDWMV